MRHANSTHEDGHDIYLNSGEYLIPGGSFRCGDETIYNFGIVNDEEFYNENKEGKLNRRRELRKIKQKRKYV